MKKLFLLLIVVAVITGCSKHEVIDSPQSNDDSVLKDWDMTVDLMAGQHINIGTVTILDAEDGFIEITYTLTGGWTMYESHVYAGLDSEKPVNKPGAPKVGKFPFKTDHDPAVSSFTYVVPSGDHLNTDDPFAIAAHCAVTGPNGQGETGWATGNASFSDKGWGTYIYDFYNNATYTPIEFYAIEYNDNGELILSLINGPANQTDVIMIESFNGSGSIEAAGYDPISGNLFFVIGNTLYANNLNGEDVSVVVGTLSGLPIGGVFMDGNYYYVDGDPASPNFMEIIEVTLTYDPNTGTWTLSENSDFSAQIDNGLDIIDLATDGIDIYLIGTDINGAVEMFIFDGSGYSIPIQTELPGTAQIAFGADGLMYAIVIDANGNNVLSLVNLGSGDVDPAIPGDGPIKDGDNGEAASEDLFGEFVAR